MWVEVRLEDARWQEVGLEALCLRAAQATLADRGIAAEACELSLLGCDDVMIADLNAEFRGKPTPTNVLSWPAEERAAAQDGATPAPPVPMFEGAELELGDIAISYDTCAREAAEAGKPMADHVMHLLIHGVLHLLGYDHERDLDATLMEGIEVKILGNLGLPDPYMGHGR